jgi:PIN domain
MSWPRKVFLESTALFQLGNKLQKPEFAKLLERREYLKFDLLVSEVSWAEYIRQRAEKMDELAGSIKPVGARLGEWDQDYQNINAALAQLGKIRRDVGGQYATKAKEIGIQILEIPVVDVHRLFQMSVERIPPFEQSKDDKSEKGFRDALIKHDFGARTLCRMGRRSMKLSLRPILSYSFDSTKVAKPIRPPIPPKSWSNLEQVERAER